MRYESDVCIVGGGISAAMLAQKLFELKPALNVVVVEAGSRSSTRKTALPTASGCWTTARTRGQGIS